MRFLSYEILRTMVFSDRITGNTCTRRRERIETIDIVEHVAEVQRVCRCEVMVNAQAKLVPVVPESSSRERSICADIGLRKQTQQVYGESALRKRIGGIGRRHLVEWVGLTKKDVEELMRWVGTEPGGGINALRAHRREITLPFGEGWDGAYKAAAVAVAEALVKSEEEGLVPAHRSANASAELVLLQGLDYGIGKPSCVKCIITQKFPERTVV